MSILFTANIGESYQKKLISVFPEQEFIFARTIENAKKYLPQAEIIVTFGEDLSEKEIEQANQLKWIMIISAGMDKMPLDVIKKRNILVTNARGIHKIPMAEYVISMLLQVYRQEKVLISNEQNHVWDKSLKMLEITGSTMVIIGTGAIGQEVARLGKAFQMKTIGVSRSGKQVEYFDENVSTNKLDHVLPRADFVISVVPSTKETRELFTYNEFKLMQKEAVFLNMGRGDVVKEEDLLQALQQKEIAHAVIDVFNEEPLSENSPLWEESNITVTPHLSGVSTHYLRRALDIFKENLTSYIKGKDQFVNKIDVRRGY